MLAPLAAAILAMSAIVPAHAADPKATSMVVDANTGAVLHNKSGDEKVYPASLTKMMTLYMTFELIELGRLDYDSKIKMTQEGADAAPSKLDLDAGEELTVLNAIKALVTKSANDVAIALAMHIGGTETNFARLMTRKARDIGMANTTFRNASGLPDPEQTTTARDMITLGLRLQDDFPRQYRLFSTRTFTYGGKNYRNHNTLLTRYRGTDGIKTGYTRASGFNLVSSVRRDGKHVVAAVFGGDSARERNAKMQSLLNAALAKASTQVTRKPALVATRAAADARRQAAGAGCRSTARAGACASRVCRAAAFPARARHLHRCRQGAPRAPRHEPRAACRADRCGARIRRRRNGWRRAAGRRSRRRRAGISALRTRDGRAAAVNAAGTGCADRSRQRTGAAPARRPGAGSATRCSGTHRARSI